MPWSIVKLLRLRDAIQAQQYNQCLLHTKYHCVLSTNLFQLSSFVDTPIAAVRSSCSHACGHVSAVQQCVQILSKELT